MNHEAIKFVHSIIRHEKPGFQLISRILNSANRSKITSNFMNTQSYCPSLSTLEKIRLNFSNFGLITNWQYGSFPFNR